MSYKGLEIFDTTEIKLGKRLVPNEDTKQNVLINNDVITSEATKLTDNY